MDMLHQIFMVDMEHSLQTRLTPCLLMPWLLVSPGYHKAWYWLCIFVIFFIEGQFHELHNINAKELCEMQLHVYVFAN